MRKQGYVVLGLLGLLVVSCNKKTGDDAVVSQRYIHKYGYAVSKEDWDSKNYPGQVVTHLTNGVTITATYENGILHGPYTETYPNSQIAQVYRLFNQGAQVKELSYDISGMPVKESIQLSPSRISVTLWYHDGIPLSIEEYVNEELLEGQYFTANNEIEARVEKGNGKRVRRSEKGELLSKDDIEEGYMVKRESFYPNGSPESIIFYSKGKMHGEKRTFSSEGEPLAVEEWVGGKLHGLSTYFKNGTKYLEVSYLYGQKNGQETHYLDGNLVQQEISWENDKKHGPATFYIEGAAHTKWHYDGKEVSRKTFEENVRLDEMITHISPKVQLRNAR